MSDEQDATWVSLSAATKNVVRWLEQGAERAAPKKPAAEAETECPAPAAEVTGRKRPTRAGAARSSALAEYESRGPDVSEHASPTTGGRLASTRSLGTGSPRELYAPHAGAIGWVMPCPL